MNRPRHLLRRSAAVLVGALLGIAGALAIGHPATAQPVPELAGACQWDSGEWAITWTVTSNAPPEITSYRVADMTTDGGDVDGIAPDAPGTYPRDAQQPLTGSQLLPEEATAASLTVEIEWEDQHTGQAQGELSIPADCDERPEPPAEIGTWSFDCDSLTITIDNATDDDAALRFVPTTGEPVDVGVAGGESATVAFPASPRLAVDVQSEGRSIVDPDTPIEITAAQWAERACDEGGEGGDLPATGRPIGLIAGGAAALLALGLGLSLIARRRRITFTA